MKGRMNKYELTRTVTTVKCLLIFVSCNSNGIFSRDGSSIVIFISSPSITPI